jgi:hypothetical protein
VYDSFLKRLYLDIIPISVLGNGIFDFCKSIDLGVHIDDDLYSVGNIEYDTLDDS